MCLSVFILVRVFLEVVFCRWEWCISQVALNTPMSTVCSITMIKMIDAVCLEIQLAWHWGNKAISTYLWLRPSLPLPLLKGIHMSDKAVE